jgi:hypothetical protein
MPRARLTPEQVRELTKKSLERTIVRRREEIDKRIKELYEKERMEIPLTGKQTATR